MEAPVNLDVVDTVMEMYFPCPLCQQKFLSVERVQDHLPNCYLQSLSFLNSNVQSCLSPSNPQDLDVNVHSENFPFRLEIIKTESEDLTEDDRTTDYQVPDKSEESSSRKPVEIYDNLAIHRQVALHDDKSCKNTPATTLTDDITTNHKQVEHPETRSNTKIHHDSIENSLSTCTKNRFLCSYCPRKFPTPSAAHQHKECHTWRRKNWCLLCGEHFCMKLCLTVHMKSHHEAQGDRISMEVKENQATSNFPGKNLEQNPTPMMPPKLTPANENFAHNESMETMSLSDLSVKGPITHPETTSTNYIELDNVQQSAAAADINGTTINKESNDPIIRASTCRRVRPARPGDEIEIMTAWGRNIKCDLCDKMFLTRMIARDHRLSHFDKPQLPCYIAGCSQILFSRVQLVKHLKSVHHVQFRKGKPFIGSRRAAFNITGPRKVVGRQIIPTIRTARQPSRKLQIKSPKFDQNTSAETGRPSPGETSVFPCGICDGSFENVDAFNCHMLATHTGPEDSLAKELEEIGTPVENNFGRVQSTCEGEELPVEVIENRVNQVTLNLPANLNARTQRKGPVPRDPTVEIVDKMHFYCGFRGCEEVFYSGKSRYRHYKKFHDGAHRLLLSNSANLRLAEKKANDTTNTQLKESSHEEQETADMDSPPDIPSVKANGKKYFFCDVRDCAIVVTNLQAWHLHQKKHHMSSEQTKTAQNSVGPDPRKRKVSPKEPKQLQDTLSKIAEGKEAEILDGTLGANQPQMPEFSMHNDDEMSDPTPERVLAVIVDEDFEVDEQEISHLRNQSMDTLEFIDTDESLVQQSPFVNEDFNVENISQSDNGGLGSLLQTKANECNLNPVCHNMSKRTSKEKAVSHPLAVKDQKSRSKGRPQLHPTIQVGSKKLFCCGFPSCTGVFNSRSVRDAHHKRHRMGFKNVNSRLKLAEGGVVWDSAEGCYLIE